MMKTKAFFLIQLFMLTGLFAYAQGPNNSGTYYRNADGKSGEALKTAMYNIIKNPDVTSYSGLREAYKKTDVRSDGYIRDWYSNITHYEPGSAFSGGTSKEGDGYNREHSVPQSWFSKQSPMVSDIVHVLPTDAKINGMRSDYPFGEVNPSASNYKQSANGYSKFGNVKAGLGYTGAVFEPNDEIKGDIARIYFYMATCYEDRITGWSGESFTGSSKYQPLAQWTFDMMQRWSKQDPVDEVERARNLAVYEVQSNRNPFVDYPGLEDYIWGSKKSVVFSYNNYAGGGDDPITDVIDAPLFTPAGGNFTDFIEVTIATATEGATIYYTTDGSQATGAATRYQGPITLTETTTLKAVAMKDGRLSSQTEATFRINKGGDTPGGKTANEEVTIALNNAFFGTSYSGSISNDNSEITGTQDGITVVYSLGTGNNRYCNDSQIRLYQNNTLTVSTSTGTLNEIEFVLATTASKILEASTGTVSRDSNPVWTGNADEVVFNVNSGSGNMQIAQLKIKRSIPSAVNNKTINKDPVTVVYTISGTQLNSRQLRPGVYIVEGKKILIK